MLDLELETRISRTKLADATYLVLKKYYFEILLEKIDLKYVLV